MTLEKEGPPIINIITNDETETENEADYENKYIKYYNLNKNRFHIKSNNNLNSSVPHGYSGSIPSPSLDIIICDLKKYSIVVFLVVTNSLLEMSGGVYDER